MIPQMEPLFESEEREAVCNYMYSGGWLTEYERTRELEAMIAEYVGSRHCIMMPNGTLALYAVLAALYVDRDESVLVPDLTMIATANAVKMVGASVVFADIEPATLCLDRTKARPRGQTGAVILVELNGRSPNMQFFAEWAESEGLTLIEDSCQALGSRWRGKHLGTFGVAGVFSFSCQKIISTGNGGCVVTDDDWIARRVRLLKDFGREKGGSDIYDTFGVNLKFTDLQAVVGIEQMKKLPQRVERKKKIYALYRDLLGDMPQVYFIPTDLENTAPWFVDVLVEKAGILSDYLRKRGIGTRRMYPALHSTPVYNVDASYPVSEKVSQHGLWLPSACNLTDEQIYYVCDQIRKFYA